MYDQNEVNSVANAKRDLPILEAHTEKLFTTAKRLSEIESTLGNLRDRIFGTSKNLSEGDRPPIDSPKPSPFALTKLDDAAEQLMKQSSKILTISQELSRLA